MEFHQNNPYTNKIYPPLSRSSGDALAMAAMIMGILAAIMCATLTFYPTFVFGSIGIVLALLSRGRAPKPDTKARIGLVCAVAGIVFNCFVMVATLKAVYTNPQILQEANELIKERYGMTYEEMIDAILNSRELPY